MNLLVGDQNLLLKLFNRKLNMNKDLQTKKYLLLFVWRDLGNLRLLIFVLLFFFYCFGELSPFPFLSREREICLGSYPGAPS